MSLEAVMVCCDNSAYMANGDYLPNRLNAQNEAINYILTLKTQNNAESLVGLVAMAGKRIELLASPCRDLGAIFAGMTKIRPSGACNFIGGLKTAQLALKHRQNKKLHEHIILFVGSPVLHSTSELVKLGKFLKKNNVSVDIINFGDENSRNENPEKLESFINAVNNHDNSRLVNVPPGPHNLSDMVISTILIGKDEQGVAASSNDMLNQGAYSDPQLALALKISMDEERERQQKIAADAVKTATQTESVQTSSEVDDEEMLLQQAIAMSMVTEEPITERSKSLETKIDVIDVEKKELDPSDDSKKDEITAALNDPNFMNDVLSSLPGVHRDEIDLNKLMKSLNSPNSSQETQGEKKDNKKEDS